MLDGDNLLRAMDYAPPLRGEPLTGWGKFKATCRAIARLPENLRRLNEMVDELESTGAVKRFERCSRILDNQQNSNRQMLGEVQNMSRAIYDVGTRLAAPEQRTALPAQD